MAISKELNRLPTALSHFRARSGTLDDTGWLFCYFLFSVLLLLPFIFIVLINTEFTMSDKATQLDFEIFAGPLLLTLAWVSTCCLPQTSFSPHLADSLGDTSCCDRDSLIRRFMIYRFFNVLTGSGEEVLVDGTIVKIDSYSARYSGNRNDVTFQFEGRDVTLSVTGKGYDRLHVGSYYSRKMKWGGLGYYYTWGVSIWK